MSLLNIIAIIISLTGLFSYINYRYIKLPASIGLMTIALIFSLFLILLHVLGIKLESHAIRVISQIDFSKTLLGGMLSFLLFAGSLQLTAEDLMKQKWVVSVLAIFGTILSTFLVGIIMYYVFYWMHIEMSFIFCLLFGALISPTDPIAVLSMLKNANAPRPLQAKIAGESLFNDGVGIVIFISLLQLVTSDSFTTSEVVLLFLREAIGGAILGFIMGWFACILLRTVEDHNVAVLITLTLVSGGYALATELETSGPIAMVVAGLFIGSQIHKMAMSEHSRIRLETFWELIDEILNALLFVLIGLEVLAVKFQGLHIVAGLIAIVVVLFCRLVSVWIPIRIFSFYRTFTKNVVLILTWGGLRGALPVAMALTMPSSPMREIILTVTYLIVVFSILVQGLTMQTIIFGKKPE